MAQKIGFISLGCSKNLVDTEMMIGYYKENGNERRAERQSRKNGIS